MSSFERKIIGVMQNVEPDFGHEKRFEAKLRKLNSRKSSINRYIFLYAASVIILLSAGVWYFNMNSESSSEELLTIENHEFIESERFYQQQIEEKLSTIKAFDIEHEAVHDIQEFDQSLKALKNDLTEAPGDSRVIEAVLNTYMLKNEELDIIVHKLKNIS